MARVLMVFTGGTISMRAGRRRRGRAGVQRRGDPRLRPDLRRIADLEVVDFGRFPGPHMNPRADVRIERDAERADPARPRSTGRL